MPDASGGLDARHSAIPVAPSLAPTLARSGLARPARALDRRALRIVALAAAQALAIGVIAHLLGAAIGAITNALWYGRWSTELVSPGGAVATLPWWRVLLTPVAGGLVVGAMARWGAQAIRGHGIPEAMEQVLRNRSRIPARMLLMKPLSAAVAIGTGGPFGAEGPIIATGGAFGSLVGQLLPLTAAERKTLLAAGAAAGMAATFGSPISATLLAVELLLFEYRPTSLIPVAIAAAIATGVRAWWDAGPAFAAPALAAPGLAALTIYLALGLVMGVAAVAVTKLVYAVEDVFERLPLHWMWWPALGGVVVGAVGLVAPRTLGVGYDNIAALLHADLAPAAAAALCAWKLLSWSIALGSGTSGGTLAPLLTIGGACGALAGAGIVAIAPHAGVDPSLAALVGMAAMFAGASRAALASAVFALEAAGQASVFAPLLGACAASYLVSLAAMRESIMTEKIARRGVRVAAGHAVEAWDLRSAREAMSAPVAALDADQAVGAARARFAGADGARAFHGYPVLDTAQRVIGVLTRRDLFAATDDAAPLRSLVRRPPIVVAVDATLREAVETMLVEDVGRLVVVDPRAPDAAIGMLTRGDVVRAQRAALDEARQVEPGLLGRRRGSSRS